ncbi:MAG: adenylyl-sulfate kinase [Clostridia bacterium]|nr:adenylyl-sulfate kinase [Clostridia bacterium]
MMINITEINEKVKENAMKFVADTDKNYFSQIRKVAQHIYDGRNERPIVLLSGPSGSGKTTTAHVLEAMLDEMGCQTHALSMDNYFLSLSDEEKIGAQEGTIDLESPSRLNIPLLNSQLEDIVNCKPVELPVYDFPTSTSLSSGEILERKPGELVILEGIHALNPSVITLPDDKTEKVYISVRTRIVCDGHTIHPENVRLLRRMIRDNINRGRSFAQTCTACKSVKRGEELYVMPYKHRSDFDIDTFIPYELGVYKNFFSMQPESLGNCGEMGEVIRLLTPAVPIPEPMVPENSLIREFIGK